MFGNQQARQLVFCLLALMLLTFELPETLMAQTTGSAVGQPQSPFVGSVPTGQATGKALDLSLKEAFARALQYNLGVVESNQDTRAAHAVRLHNLNALLPDLSARVSGTIQQIDLKALGVNPSIPGFHIATLVGPFGVADARAYLSQEIFNWSDIKNLKSASESERASQDTYRSDRDLVILITGNAYLIVISDSANVDSIGAQVKTAETLYQNNIDLNHHGLIANIDLLRSQVELKTQQQRLIAAQNQFNIDKLALARVVGLPKGQEFRLTDTVPYAPLETMALTQALQQAYATRPDYLSAKSELQAAKLAFQGAAAENYPWLSSETAYGVIGSPNFGTSHGTFSAALTLNIPIFQGSKVRADKLQADSVLERRKAELADLDGKIDDQVRTAFFNLKSSSELVAVAKSSIDLANQTLTQAQDRFNAGVADNLEVVQAQESVASANQSYIASLYSFNLAKISLAQALGVAEQSASQYLGVR